jgi:alkylation response protein AidB-like acyl-CoA dehydrogenase
VNAREQTQAFLAALGDPAEVGQIEETTFLGHRFDAGLAWVHFPVGSGGLGIAPSEQVVVDELLGAAGCPAPRQDIAHLMIAPTIAVHGTLEQRSRWLRPLFTGEEIWCQLFSEPGAGSDLASLAMRAEPDGESWVISGEKVWSTFAHLSRWAMVLVRTDPDVAKHRGLTMFVVEMQAEGVGVAPLRQLTGQTEFNQVHFDEVRVPDSARLGDIGAGWTVTMTTLMNERSNVGDGLPVMGGDFGAALREHWGQAAPGSELHRDGVVAELVRREVMTLLTRRGEAAALNQTPGPDGSLNKLMLGESNQDASSLLVTLHGPLGTLYPSDFAPRGDVDIDTFTSGTQDAPAQERFLRTRANTIEGGTTEVMRNILGERVLGLPGEPRADKGLTWSETPRN